MSRALFFAKTIILLIGIVCFLDLKMFASDGLKRQVLSNRSLQIDVELPAITEYRFTCDSDETRIDAQGLSHSRLPGEPMLPSKRFLLSLPFGAEIRNVEVQGGLLHPVPGRYKIMPTKRVLPVDPHLSYPISESNSKAGWHLKYDAIYNSTRFFPQETGELVGAGTLGRHSYALVSVCPFQYHPIAGTLSYYRSATLRIDYTVDPAVLPSRSYENAAIDDRALELFGQSPTPFQMPLPYEAEVDHPEGPVETEPFVYCDYLIITTDGLVNHISDSFFISWKQSLGYKVKIITVTSPKITNQPGIDLAEQIRNFLRSNYANWGIRYVLFVGDYITVPMRICFPYPDSHEPLSEYPTDYYYADLSYADLDSWDSDGDGFHGEFNHDSPDFLAEVYVGRIPVSDGDRITYTLNKFVAFEQDTGAWKKSALHTGAVIYFTNEENTGVPFVDGARFANEIEIQTMSGWNISHYSEQAGLEPSLFPWPALNMADFSSDWKDGQYSIVNWFAHGLTLGNGAVRKIWSWDDGDSVPEANEFTYNAFISTACNLDDDHPAVMYVISCSVGSPKQNPNGPLGLDLLTKPSWGASASIVCSSHIPFLTGDWPISRGGVEEIGLDFNSRMILEAEKVGEAFFNAKFYCFSHYGWPLPEEYCTQYSMNLFGDPTLVLAGIP